MNQKTVYAYHPETREYVGTTLADESPAGPPGVYHIPADATEQEPPPPRAGYTRNFKDDFWQYWPIVGEDVPAGQEPTLDEVKRDRVKTIDTDRDFAIAAGFEHDGHAFDSYPDALANIAATFSMAVDDPEFTTSFITMDDTVIELDNAAARSLGRAAYEHKREQMLRARQLKDLILLATSVDEVRAVAW